MKKFGAMVVALVLACSLAGCVASSKLPVNGFVAQKMKDPSITWFSVKCDDLINELNRRGKEAGYPELQIMEEYESPVSYGSHYYSISQDGSQLIYIAPLTEFDYGPDYTDCIFSITIYTNISDQEEASASGFYLDQIVGMFSPRDKDEIEEKLMMFSAVEGMGEYISGNVLYKRTSDEVVIFANEDEAVVIALGTDAAPPPHLIKPE